MWRTTSTSDRAGHVADASRSGVLVVGSILARTVRLTPGDDIGRYRPTTCGQLLMACPAAEG
jgi:hypothetical protein